MFEDDEATTPLELGADQPTNMEEQATALELAEDVKQTLEDEAVETRQGGPLEAAIVRTVLDRYQKSQRSRDADEKRWLEAYQNYRGIYGKHVKFSEHEKSRVFVKATKTKVLAAYGQVLDVLFGSTKFPLSIQETKVPEGAEEFVHFDPTGGVAASGVPGIEQGPGMTNIPTAQPEVNPYDVGYAGDGLDVPPGAKLDDITQGLKASLKQAADKLVVGPAINNEPQFKPAHSAAMKMEKLIHDQIEESNGAQELRSSLFEACLLGTGVLKGPFTFTKTLHQWERDPQSGVRVYKPKNVKVPRIEFCSLWDSFPDPNAHCMEESEWFIQRHKMSKSQLRSLRSRPYFNKDNIADCIRMGPNYVLQDYENELIAENQAVQPQQTRFEVLEYWGVMDREDLEYANIPLDARYTELDEIQVNVWVCHGKILRIVTNPFTPARIPYLAFDYERNPYSFFGVGVAENMSDSQAVMNGHARMAIDNLALAGNVILDIDEDALVPGQSYELYAGKHFKRQGGQPGQAIYAINIPNTAPENLQMFDKFRQIADESTGIPSFAHGQTGIMSTTRTAAGMSMLMGAASLGVKTVVKNMDDFLLKPLGEAMFQWNMSFYEGDLEIVGDLEVKAGGAASLMQKEVLSQRLTNFGQLLANPAIAPWIKIPAYVKAFTESLELEGDEFLNDLEEAQVMAQIIGAAGGLGAQAPAPVVNEGNLGEPGNVPGPAQPGTEEFSGNEQPQGEAVSA